MEEPSQKKKELTIDEKMEIILRKIDKLESTQPQPFAHAPRTLNHLRGTSGLRDVDAIAGENEDLHAESVRKDLEMAGYKSKWAGVMRSMPDQAKSLKELMVGLSTSQMTIMNVLKHWGEKDWTKVAKYAAIAIITVGFMYFFFGNQHLQDNIYNTVNNPDNWKYLIIALAVVAVIVYYFFRGRRK